MARRRHRIRRLFGAALLAALLLGLLELNELLPGGWPGGGGRSAFRQVDEPGDDASRLRRGEHEPTWPTDGVTVTVRRADGTAGGDWHLDLPDGRRLVADAEGRVRLGRDDRPEPYFGLAVGERGVTHTPAAPGLAPEWVVHVPSDAPARAAPGSTKTAELLVLAAESQAPLAGAQVDVRAPGWSRTKTSDDEGRVVLALLPGPQQVTVAHPDRRTRTLWLHPEAPPSGSIALEALVRRRFTFVDAEDGGAATVERVRVLAPGGEVLFASEPSDPGGLAEVEVELGATEAAGAVLEVGGGDHPFLRRALADASDALPLAKGRRLALRATDPRGQALKDVRTTTWYVPPTVAPAEGLREAVEVTTRGGDAIRLPEGVDAEVLVEAAFSAPRLVRIAAADAGPLAAKLEPGSSVRVRISDEAGAPLVGARVVVRTDVDGRLVEREVRTDASGLARVTELPATPLEVYAHAKGHAWAVTTAPAGRRRDVLELGLVRARPLRFLVETPLGIPLGRVRVRAEPQGGGAPDVVPPHAPPWLTDDEGGLVLPDLRIRPYRVRLSHPDMAPVELDALVPGDAVHFVTMSPRGGGR